ncbi:MAG: DHH family phosphoesterase, partial [Clostridia bacterium]
MKVQNLSQNLSYQAFCAATNQNPPKQIAFGAKPIPDAVLSSIKSQLLNDKVKDIDIYCHFSTDEDSINSSAVFSNWLKSHGKKSNICIDKRDVKDLYFEPSKFSLKHGGKPADKAVILDFNDKGRLPAPLKSLFAKNKESNILGLDHHIVGQGAINGLYIDDTARSCCSVVYRFLEGLKEKITKT